MAITAVTLKWSVLVLPTFEVEIFDRLVLAIFLLISLLLFAILSLASLFLFAIFMSLVSLFKYGIALFGLGLVYFFNELISLRFLYIYDSPVLSDPPLQVLSSESLSLSVSRARRFLSLRACLRKAFLISVRTSCAKFAPSGPFLLAWGLLAPPRFLIGVPSLLKRRQSRVL